MGRVSVVSGCKLSLGIATVIALTSSTLAADDSEKSCDGTTVEMVECLKTRTAQWDKRMTLAYQQAIKQVPPLQRERLRAAQRLWIQYRNANCRYYASGEGTIARLDAGQCVNRMTEARAREVENLIRR